MDFDERGSVTDVIIAEVSEERGVDPLQLESVYSAVDPDALRTLVEEPNTVSSLQFTYAGCDIIVEQSGSVRVIPKR